MALDSEYPPSSRPETPAGYHVDPGPLATSTLDRRPAPLPPPRRKWLHLLLFVLTVGTTTLAGALHYAGFLSNFGTVQVHATTPQLILGGFSYSFTILSILGAHELGHYLACRYYRIDATLPFFLPAPLLTGTLGAVIRIRGAFTSKAALFDIAAAGPLAGFLVLIPLLFLGLSLSTLAPLPERFVGWSLGEPPLFRFAAWLVWGTPASHLSLNIHQMVFASWFGLFATAANLLQFGQLDGGHVSYAALGRWSTAVSLVTVSVAIVLTMYSMSWLLITFFMLLMLVIMGPRHPRVIDEAYPLDTPRRVVALLLVVVFILSFTPALIEPFDLVPR